MRPLFRKAARLRDKSLRLKIGLFYGVLAVCNVMLFAVFTYSSGTRVVERDFVQDADLRLNRVRMSLSLTGPLDFEKTRRLLVGIDIDRFLVFDSRGVVTYAWRMGPLPGSPVAKEYQQAARELLKVKRRSELPVPFRRFNQELRIDGVLPLPLRGESTHWLHLKFVPPESAYLSVWNDVLHISIWAILLHVLFGFFFLRIFTSRIDDLMRVSNRMASGDLTARVEWSFKQSDAIDLLGQRFNSMAEHVQSTVETISRLNEDIQNELEIGRDVQAKFFPDPELVRRLKVAVYLNPVRTVTGDIYNIIEQPGGRGIFFADASGHGISAALITGIALVTLDYFLAEEADPGVVFQRLNETLVNRLSNEFFMTAMFLSIDDSGLLEYVNAGHPGMLLFRGSSEEVAEFQALNPPLGLDADVRMEKVSYRAAPGDRILMFSDGLLEMRDSAGNGPDMDHIKGLVRSNCTESLDELLGKLRDYIDLFQERTDDVSMLLAEV